MGKWITFCASKSQKKLDPNVYDEDFLRDFLRALENNEIVEDKSGKLELVQRVKEIQRKDREGKEKWVEFCHMHDRDKYDPNMYGPTYLTAFIEAYEKGEWPPPMPFQQQKAALMQAFGQQQGGSFGGGAWSAGNNVDTPNWPELQQGQFGGGAATGQLAQFGGASP